MQIDYRADGSVGQFRSNISVSEGSKPGTIRKEISVNDPLRYQVSYQVTSTVRCSMADSAPDMT